MNKQPRNCLAQAKSIGLCCYGGAETWCLFSTSHYIVPVRSVAYTRSVETGSGDRRTSGGCCGKRGLDDDDLEQAEAELYQQGVRQERARKSVVGADKLQSQQPDRKEAMAAIKASRQDEEPATDEPPRHSHSHSHSCPAPLT